MRAQFCSGNESTFPAKPHRVIGKLSKWRHYAVAVARARRSAQARLARSTVRRVLVVCYGNIYRSPFVESCLNDAGRSIGLCVRSAGFHRREGREVEPAFLDLVLVDFGMDLSAHRSRLLTKEDMDWADLVLIMDGHNYRLMHDQHPTYLDKCIWLGAVTSETPVLISDPYGTSPDKQRRIARQLHIACRALATYLNAEATVT